jgi:hypothetical protein
MPIRSLQDGAESFHVTVLGPGTADVVVTPEQVRLLERVLALRALSSPDPRWFRAMR